MSEDAPTQEQIERLQAFTLHEIEELLARGGEKKTIRHRCSACSHQDTFDITVQDADLLVRILPALTAAKKGMSDDKDTTGRQATKILRDLEELSNAELAEYIVRLQRELDAEPA